MATNRSQIRSLLIPGCYQAGGDRGVPFEDDEIDLVADAYMNSGMPEAMRVLRRLTAMPYLLQCQQKRLQPLRSISAAYKQAQIPYHFRNQQEDYHARRKSTQKVARRTPQPPDPTDLGAPSFTPGGIIWVGNTFNTSATTTTFSSAGGGGGTGQDRHQSRIRHAWTPSIAVSAADF